MQGRRTQIPPKHIWAPLVSMNTTQIPPDTPQTSPRHPSDMSRELKMSTDNNTRQQTPPVILQQHLSVSEGVWGVCWRLLSSVDILPSLEMSWGVWGMSEGCLWVFEWYSWKSEMLECVWGVSGSSILAVWSCNTTLAQPWKAQFFSPDHTEALGWFLFWWKLKFQLLHGFKLFHFVHRFWNTFCFRCRTTPSAVRNVEVEQI